MKVMTNLRSAAVGAVLFVVGGCSLLSLGPEPAVTTCAQWQSLSAGAQTDLATRMVDSEAILESVRQRQHQGPGATKTVLIQNVVQSVTKNCDVMQQPDLLVATLTMQLYGEGRAYDGRPGTPAP